jgi:hypothetical protein
MSKESEKLAKVFATKEEVDGFISNLEHLKSDGSITSDMYSSLKSDYEQRRNASLSEIDRVKGEIKELLAASQRERDNQASELRKLEIRYKTGELTEDEYRASQRTLQGTVEYLDDRIIDLSALLKAQSSSDIGGTGDTTRRVAPPAPPVEELPRERPPKAGRRFKMPGRKVLIGIGAVVVVIAVAVIAIVLMSGGKEEVKEVMIPVDVVGASSIGSLHFELVYDTAALEVMNIQSGTMAGNALFEFDSADPGRIIVGLVSSSGISGDGPIATITFTVKSKDTASTSLVLENVVAHSSMDLSKLSVSYVAGDFVADDGSFTPPTMYFAPPTGK